MRQQVIQWMLAACVLAGCGGAVEDLAGSEETLAPAEREDPAPVRYGPQVIAPTHQDLSEPLRDLPVPPAKPHVNRPRLRRPFRQSWHPPPPFEDPIIQRHPGAWKIPELLLEVEGMGQGFAGPDGPFTVERFPADPAGDVGPEHYMQIVNSSISVFDKGGRVVFGPVPTRMLWYGFGGPCADPLRDDDSRDGDGVIRYDHLADRWVVTQFILEPNINRYHECVAVSETGDPTGRYHRYAFRFEAPNDYPKLGLWPDAYYMTFNMEVRADLTIARVCALDRARMLVGDAAATLQCFDTDSFGLLPADLDGPRPPPAGSPHFTFGLGEDSTLEMWKFHVDWDEPARSSFTGPHPISVVPFTPLLCEEGGEQTTRCVPQRGDGAPALDSLGDVLMNRAPYRNFGGHQSVLLTHSVWADEDRGGMRWYELRHPESPIVYQQGTYAPDSHYRWMGSIASDGMGNIALGYSISSSKLYPSIRYTVRRASDPLGKMGGEKTLARGHASFVLNNWGDYSSMNVDPVDGCTFWYTNMYLNAPEAVPESARREEEEDMFNLDWSTRIGSFRMPGCDLLAPTVTLLSPGNGATVRGEVEVLALVKDDVGVIRVVLSVDGRPVDTDKYAPYRFEWDSTKVPDGRHELLLQAYDAAGNVGQASVTVIVANEVCGTTAQLLANPGFEDGPTGWRATAGVISHITSPTLPAHTGAWRAWLGGYGKRHRDTLSQELSIPEGACGAELTFWLRVHTTETASSARDTLTVRLLDPRGRTVATLARYSNLDAGPDYTQRSFDLSAFRGRTLRIVFESDEDASSATGFLIDDAGVNVRVRSTLVKLGESSGASARP
ncbi:MAG TPA: Ig-like domain-containing protein [Archangium sp.]|uniref:Ig-like domain-containing protein n=1 Tax=Archangium sp. TaxID=1872627 RepID=UPI002E32A241|nr:Ig-like domain-containing protein [Archangium sp.]HEX5751646.1 Ig-like domain-containing protein [Archangium sp.]